MSAYMKVTLGVQFADHREPKVIHIPIDTEVDPEDAFRAGNRIDSLDGDLANLPLEWQRNLRRAIDTVRAPSMSVQDTIELIAPGGVSLGGWRCDPCGFSALAPTEPAS